MSEPAELSMTSLGMFAKLLGGSEHGTGGSPHARRQTSLSKSCSGRRGVQKERGCESRRENKSSPARMFWGESEELRLDRDGE